MMRISVRRARIRVFRVWLPWWLVECPCCAYSAAIIGRVTALDAAHTHAAIHSPSIRRSVA